MKHKTGPYHTSVFSGLSKWTSHVAGQPGTFLLAVLTILVWIMTGSFFHFSDTWQLVINTGTTIVTFLMVFLIQNTQNRESYAIQLKLDELIRAADRAHNSLLDIEELTEHELLSIKSHYGKLAEHARHELRQGKTDFGSPDVKLSG